MAHGPLKKNLTPLSKGGRIDKHSGKGSDMATMPNRNTLSKLQKPAFQNINNYAKASPMGQPSDNDGDEFPTGAWAGNGM